MVRTRLWGLICGFAAFLALGTQAKGETKAELETPQPLVKLSQTDKKPEASQVRILGSVKSGGAIAFKRNFHLTDAIALVGGLTAKPSRVSGKLIRYPGTVISLNIEQAIAMPESEANLLLKPDDLILLEDLEAVIPRQVNVLGQVAKPGVYALTEGLTVEQLLSRAGGWMARAALGEAYVLRGAEKITLALSPILLQLMDKTDEDIAKFPLQAGDVLVIPELAPRVGVLGQVMSPGYYPMSESKPLTVRQALSTALGPTEFALLRKAVILRMDKGKAMALPVDLETILKQGKADKSPTLQDRDVLFVPTLPRLRKVGVLGQVMKPAYYPLSEKESMTVLEALSFAGGPTEFGFMRKAVILRMVNGKQTAIPIDFDEILKKGKLYKNIVLQDGDVLFIPSRVRRNFNMPHTLIDRSFGDFPMLDGWRY